jgi:hypothetical protein
MIRERSWSVGVMEYWIMRKNKSPGHQMDAGLPVADSKSKIKKLHYSNTPLLHFATKDDKLKERTKETVSRQHDTERSDH